MSDNLETLVRDTLVDPRRRLAPDPEHYRELTRRIRTLRLRRTAWWAGTTAAVTTAAVILAATVLAGPEPAPGPRPAVVPATSGGTEPATIVSGRVNALAATANALYLLAADPPTVVRVDPSSRQVTGAVAAPANATGIAVEAATNRLWLWTSGNQIGSSSGVIEYDLATLTPRHETSVPNNYVFGAAALDGALWLTTPGGLYRAPAGGGAGQWVPGLATDTYGIAADPTRHRLIVIGAALFAVDTANLRLTAGAPDLDLSKATVAVVAGQIWVGGYGSGYGPRLVHLDPDRLRPTGTSPVAQEVGPGAIVWSGAAVVWVRNGGDEGLTCMNPADGAIVRQWREVQGPVASTTGTALGAQEVGATWLTLDRSCTG